MDPQIIEYIRYTVCRWKSKRYWLCNANFWQSRHPDYSFRCHDLRRSSVLHSLLHGSTMEPTRSSSILEHQELFSPRFKSNHPILGCSGQFARSRSQDPWQASSSPGQRTTILTWWHSGEFACSNSTDWANHEWMETCHTPQPRRPNSDDWAIICLGTI